MPRKRPGTVTAAAILCIVFGSLGLLIGLCGVGVQQLQSQRADAWQARGRDAVEDFTKKEFPWLAHYSVASAATLFVESTAMLIAGIGLFSLRRWARTVAIIFIVVGVLHMISIAMTQLVTMPAITRFRAQFLVAPGRHAEFEHTITSISIVLLYVFYLAVICYLLVTLVFLTKPRARMAFAAGRVDEDDRYERRRRPDEDRFEEERFDEDRPRRYDDERPRRRRAEREERRPRGSDEHGDERFRG